MAKTLPLASPSAESGANGAAGEGDAQPLPACSNTDSPCFTWHSAELLQGQKRVHIAHNGGVYQLQATRQGKLILTK